jgi:hypothetical protein
VPDSPDHDHLTAPSNTASNALNSVPRPAESTTAVVIPKPQPFILLDLLPARTAALYREVSPAIIDDLAKTIQHITPDNHPLVTGSKRQRQPVRFSALSSPSYSSHESSDEADISSESSCEPARSRVAARPIKKRQKLAADRPALGSGTLSQGKGGRALNRPFDWNSTSWENLNLPVNLLNLIERCKETKSRRSEAEPCPLLEYFTLGWHEVVKALYCKVHAVLVPGNYFHLHFGSRSHKGAYPGATRNTVITASAFHLAECYPAMRNQSYNNLKLSLPTQLQAPLPLGDKEEQSLQLRYKCPDETCTTWVSMTKTKGAPETELKRHTKKAHNKILGNDLPIVTPQWTQLMRVGQNYGSNGSTHYFTFPDTFRPPAPIVCPSVFSNVNHVAPSTDTWAAELGWQEYFDSISKRLGGQSNAAAKLRDLVALPSKARILSSTGAKRLLEHGLLISNKLNMSYLEEAAIWVSTMHPSLRAYFGHGGCVNTSTYSTCI